MPLHVVFSVVSPNPQRSRTLPAWVCKSPIFAPLLDGLFFYFGIEHRKGVDRLKAHKAAVRGVGRCNRSAIIAGTTTKTTPTTTPTTTCFPPETAMVSMCARAVWRQDGDTAKAVLAAHVSAKDFIKFADGKVILCKSVSFAERFAAAATGELIEATTAAGKTHKQRPKQDELYVEA